MAGREHKYITCYDLPSAKEERSKLERQGYKVTITREGGKYIVRIVGCPADEGPAVHPAEVLQED